VHILLNEEIPGVTVGQIGGTIAVVTPPAFHVMVKPQGAICNCRCQYCYYLPKEHLYPGGNFRMTEELLERFTHQYIESQSVPQVTFAWQGGEPTLMGLDFFKHAIELQKKYQRPGITISNAIQTNGIVLNDDWCRFFREHDVLVGISIDGPSSLHDIYRTDRGNHPTFDRVMAGIKLLKKHHVEFNTLTCVHAANSDYPLEVYHFLRNEVQSRYMQFIPIVLRDSQTSLQHGETVNRKSVGGKQYGDFLSAVFDEWVRRDVGKVFVQTFDAALASWAGQPPGVCIFDETCGIALVLEHNGDLYSCDHFVEPDYLLGNINDIDLAVLVGSAEQRHFGLAKRDTLPKYCQECPVRFACNGGCPKNRISLTPDGEPGLNYLCEGYRAFFNHIAPQMGFMARELAAGRPPANVMLAVARQDTEFERKLARAGRNDPCPCGSGLKFKHCHGRLR
jgi:uncharacterized protein